MYFQTLMQLLRMLLTKLIASNKLKQKQGQQLLRNAQENVNTTLRTAQREREADEEVGSIFEHCTTHVSEGERGREGGR